MLANEYNNGFYDFCMVSMACQNAMDVEGQAEA